MCAEKFGMIFTKYTLNGKIQKPKIKFQTRVNLIYQIVDLVLGFYLRFGIWFL